MRDDENPTDNTDDTTAADATTEPDAAAEPDVTSTKAKARTAAVTRKPATPEPRQTPSSTKAVVLTVLVMLLVIAAGTSGYFAVKYRGEVRSMQQADTDRARAEDIAGKYAVNAATMDFNDLAPWLKAMKTGVSDDLSKKYDGVAELVRQVMVPLRMQSTGTLLLAKVTAEVNGVYEVTSVIEVSAKSLQAAQGTQTTSAYKVSVDRNQNWLITSAGDSTSNTPLPSGSTPTVPQEQPVPAPTPAPGN